MSSKKLQAMEKRIEKIETITKPVESLKENPTPTRPKKAGKYQAFQKACMLPDNPNDPDSLSVIEVIKGKELHPNERMGVCSELWKTKYRGFANPIKDGLNVEYDLAQKQMEKKRSE